jgi:Rieske Fe-S protein
VDGPLSAAFVSESAPSPAAVRRIAATDAGGEPGWAAAPTGWQAGRVGAPVSAYPGHAYPLTTPRGRTLAVVAVAVAALGAVAALISLVVVLTQPAGSPTAAAPHLAGEPPTDVRLSDDGPSITVDWRDPAAGNVSFVVTGSQVGQEQRPMGRVGPGQTRFTLQGLDPRANYCFAVVAVYSTSEFAASPQACTARPAAPARTGARR